VDGKAVGGVGRGEPGRASGQRVRRPGALGVGAAAVAEKSNEITAIPDLLGLLDLRGAVVSIDAMGCQKAIAQAIVDAGPITSWL